MLNLGRHLATAAVIVVAIQCFTVGVLAPRLPREVFRPTLQTEYDISLQGYQSISLFNPQGGVEVKVHDKDIIRLHADIRGYLPEEFLEGLTEEDLADHLVLYTTEDSITMVTDLDDLPAEASIRVDFTLTVPENVDFAFQGMDGNITIHEGCNNVRVRSNNADVAIEAPYGDVFAESSNGRINVARAAKEVDTRTVNGGIYVTTLGGDVKCSTINGNIEVEVASGAVEACEVSVTNGDITLLFPEECSADVEAITGRGMVYRDIPWLLEETPAGKRSWRGTLGGGGAAISLRALNGDIWMTGRPL